MAKRKWYECRCIQYDGTDRPPLLISNPFKSYLNLGLSSKLKQIKSENGWTMKEFAFRSDIALPTLRDLIHGRDFPLLIHLYHFATMTGKDVDYWKGLCPEGYRTEPRGLIISQEHFISVKGGTMTFVPRHGENS